MTRTRLDLLLTEKGLVESRSKAQALIMAGKISVDGRVVYKPGLQISPTSSIAIQEEPPYASRGGLKLVAALDAFALDLTGWVCADVGASTGGFTDALLQRGALRVYAIDVGYGQLAWKLRQDRRVIVMERTNARYLETLSETVNLVTIDASFISLKLLLPVVAKWLASPAAVIALIKPQFEAGRGQVGKGGVVRDPAIHRQVLDQAVGYAIQSGFTILGLIPSPITGPAGNHEFLIYLGWKTRGTPIEIDRMIENCLAQLSPTP